MHLFFIFQFHSKSIIGIIIELNFLYTKEPRVEDILHETRPGVGRLGRP